MHVHRITGQPRCRGDVGNVHLLHEPQRQRPAFPLGGSYDAFGISPSGAVLVRPDNVIAWRSVEGGASPAETMSRVFRAMLGRR